MIDRIGSPAAADFAADRRPQSKTASKSKPEQAGEAPPAPAAKPGEGLRLVIERHEGVYVYKLIDRQTGKVVVSIPRSDIGEVAERPV